MLSSTIRWSRRLPLQAQSGGWTNLGWRPAGVRCFWWSGDDEDGKGDKKGKRRSEKGASPRSKEEADDEPTDHQEQSHEEDAGISIAGAGSSQSLQRIGIGDEAPRTPHVIALPVSPRPVFPGTLHPVMVYDQSVIRALSKAFRSQSPYIGLFLRRPEHNTHGDKDARSDVLQSTDEVFPVGTFANIANMRVVDDAAQLLLLAHRRIRVQSVLPGSSPMSVKVEHLSQPPVDRMTPTITAYVNELIATMRDVVGMNPVLRELVNNFSARLDVRDPYRLADLAGSLVSGSSIEDGVALQEILEAMDLQSRLEKALVVLKKEQDLHKLQQQISKQVEEKLSKNQREYFLREQLKSIKKELGLEKDDKEALLAKFRERMNECGPIPDAAKQVIEEELEKLSSLEKNSSEFNVTRTYIDWLTSLPWGKSTKDNLDVSGARTVLNEEHYGLTDIKERILEFIAVGNLSGSVHGKILCFVGPPGVGKTSVVRSIATALGREYFRFSVGGMSDVSEIKGHRRTYVGAMPGKIVQSLKGCKSNNPLILIDEIDKLGRGGFHGDPASAMLELLDPSQNYSFLDHYLDVPVDLSNVLFICTANVEDTIPEPLHDRMEVIRIAGYDVPEKLQIAKQYLEPKIRKQTGLTPENSRVPATLRMDESALDSLIRWYCREAGVRSLQQHMEKVFRKLALRLVSADKVEPLEQWTVTQENLNQFVGKPRFMSERLFTQTPPGVTMGLAWTSMGGSALYIETSAVRKPDQPAGSLRSTGKLGEVMKESTTIAGFFAKRLLAQVDPNNKFFFEMDVHLHVPEGATPKDGPSAGITMVTALLSLALNKPVLGNLAMTGELSLTGKVLPVGGIKEKVIAARRSGVTTLVLPLNNKRDMDELPEYLRDGLTVHYAERYEDVFRVAFPAVQLGTELTPKQEARAE